jgi:CO/xanthine dehydrogenase FAD-binding subunit
VVRRSSDYAVVAAAADVELDHSTGRVRAARVALGGVADRPVVVLPPLVGEVPDEGMLGDASRAIADATDPPGDVHASGGYRQRLVSVLAMRALTDAASRARESLGVPA